jgi:hypothetical protein
MSSDKKPKKISTPAGREVFFREEQGSVRYEQMATMKYGPIPVSEVGINRDGAGFCLFIGDLAPTNPVVLKALDDVLENHDVVKVGYAPGQPPCGEHPAIDTFGAPNIKHPMHDHSLVDALQVARSARQIQMEPPPTSLVEARQIVEECSRRISHTWITGACALDVLDAAISGTPINPSTCRAR